MLATALSKNKLFKSLPKRLLLAFSLFLLLVFSLLALIILTKEKNNSTSDVPKVFGAEGIVLSSNPGSNAFSLMAENEDFLNLEPNVIYKTSSFEFIVRATDETKFVLVDYTYDGDKHVVLSEEEASIQDVVLNSSVAVITDTNWEGQIVAQPKTVKIYRYKNQ